MYLTILELPHLGGSNGMSRCIVYGMACIQKLSQILTKDSVLSESL